MRKRWKYGFLMVCVCFSCGRLCAQESGSPTPLPNGTTTTESPDPSGKNNINPDSLRPFKIRDIIISGNRKTKPYIIERELLFKRGDSVNLTDLVKSFDRTRELLMNTTLFHEAIVYLKRFDGYLVDVGVDVRERWYLFPIPYFKPVDRNLSEWAKQGYGIDRVNYGLKFNYNNFTGRNDKLKFWLITGYTRQIQFQYEMPYIDKSLKHGLRLGFSYLTNREVNYATSNNEQLFTPEEFNDRVLSRQLSAFVDFTYRPRIRTRNSLRIAFVSQEVDSAVLKLNPNYFGHLATKVSFPEISYKLEFIDVDYIPYPQKGTSGEVGILKRGFNKNFSMWQFNAKGSKHFPLSRTTSFSAYGSAVVRLPFEQPFINQRMFGYGDFYLRGLEQYVIDGVTAALFKNTLRTRILKFHVPTPLNSHSQIPFQVFLKTYADVGYSYSKNAPDRLNNRMLYSGGFGVDVVTFYDLALRFEYSFNQLGQSGFFFHIKNDF